MDKVVFLGDSLTEGFKQLSDFDNVINMGISGNRTIEVIARIKEVISNNPKKLFLMIGTNDLLMNNGIWSDGLNVPTLTIYNTILEVLINNLNDTTLYIQAVLPVNSGVIESGSVSFFNDEINRFNEKIKALASNYNLKFINYSDNFKDVEGKLKEALTYDGVHLTELGYQTMFNSIKEYI